MLKQTVCGSGGFQDGVRAIKNAQNSGGPF